MDIYQYTGIAGAIVYLGAYALLQIHLIKGESLTYAILNFVAASMVLISMFSEFNIGSTILQIAFILLSMISIVRYIILKIPPKVTMDEMALAEHILPGIPLRRAMCVLRQGEWNTVKSGTLTTEGQAIDTVYYLVHGGAKIEKDGREISTIHNKEVIGDITLLTGEDASATVTLIQPSKLFSINAQTFKNVLDAKEDIRVCFQYSTMTAMSDRLKQANTAATLA